MQAENTRKEICVHKLLKHVNVVQCYGSRRLENHSRQFIFLEYCRSVTNLFQQRTTLVSSPTFLLLIFRRCISKLGLSLFPVRLNFKFCRKNSTGFFYLLLGYLSPILARYITSCLLLCFLFVSGDQIGGQN